MSIVSKLGRKIGVRFGRALCRRRKLHAARMLESVALGFLSGLENHDYNHKTNGESRALKVIGGFPVHTVFDVGANVGRWGLMALEAFPDAEIYCFEPNPKSYEQLSIALKSSKRAHAFNFGLGSAVEEKRFFVGEGSEVVTACKIKGMRFHDEYYQSEIVCPMETGERFLRDKGVKKVSLLKIDVEGMELEVLKGFGERISSVDVVQFEYGIFNIGSRALLVDLWTYLREMRFVVGKIYPNGVEFFDYHFTHETFRWGNYLAVREGQKSLLARLKGVYR